MEEYHRNPAVSSGFRLPDGRLTPWLSSQPMAGFYNTEPGECHHWLACERDARQPIFARLADRDHAYTLYTCRDASLSHSQYTSLYTLSDKKHLRGPPGSNAKRSNFEPSESRITDVRKWVFQIKTNYQNHLPDGSGTEGSNPGGGLVVVKNFPKRK